MNNRRDWCGATSSCYSIQRNFAADAEAYETMNIARSMLSLALRTGDGKSLGSHPLVIRIKILIYSLSSIQLFRTLEPIRRIKSPAFNTQIRNALSVSFTMTCLRLKNYLIHSYFLCPLNRRTDQQVAHTNRLTLN